MAKLDQLLDRWAGVEWLSAGFLHLDRPEAERADVERGLEDLLLCVAGARRPVHRACTARSRTIAGCSRRSSSRQPGSADLMLGQPFNDGWSTRRRLNPFERLGAGTAGLKEVTLPHDAMLDRGRDPGGDPGTAFFRPGSLLLRAPVDRPHVVGGPPRRRPVRGDQPRRRGDPQRRRGGRSSVRLQRGRGPARRPADPREENVLRAECRTAKDDSRWYSGAGLYREVSSSSRTRARRARRAGDHHPGGRRRSSADRRRSHRGERHRQANPGARDSRLPTPPGRSAPETISPSPSTGPALLCCDRTCSWRTLVDGGRTTRTLYTCRVQIFDGAEPPRRGPRALRHPHRHRRRRARASHQRRDRQVCAAPASTTTTVCSEQRPSGVRKSGRSSCSRHRASTPFGALTSR